jgi:hypothetical protein
MSKETDLERIAEALEGIDASLCSIARWTSMAGEGAMSTAERMHDVMRSIDRLREEAPIRGR